MCIRNKVFSLIYKFVVLLLCALGLVFSSGFLQGSLNFSIFNYYTFLCVALAFVFYFFVIIMLIVDIAKNGSRGAPLFSIHLKGGIITGLLANILLYIFILKPDLGTGALPMAGNLLVHFIVPIMVLLDWILFDPKGRFYPSDPVVWLLLPYFYYAYVLIRSNVSAMYFDSMGYSYPYSFIDADTIGWNQVLINIAIMSVIFPVIGYILFGVDKLLGHFHKKKLAELRSAMAAEHPEAPEATFASEGALAPASARADNYEDEISEEPFFDDDISVAHAAFAPNPEDGAPFYWQNETAASQPVIYEQQDDYEPQASYTPPAAYAPPVAANQPEEYLPPRNFYEPPVAQSIDVEQENAPVYYASSGNQPSLFDAEESYTQPQYEPAGNYDTQPNPYYQAGDASDAVWHEGAFSGEEEAVHPVEYNYEPQFDASAFHATNHEEQQAFYEPPVQAGYDAPMQYEQSFASQNSQSFTDYGAGEQLSAATYYDPQQPTAHFENYDNQSPAHVAEPTDYGYAGQYAPEAPAYYNASQTEPHAPTQPAYSGYQHGEAPTGDTAYPQAYDPQPAAPAYNDYASQYRPVQPLENNSYHTESHAPSQNYNEPSHPTYNPAVQPSYEAPKPQPPRPSYTLSPGESYDDPGYKMPGEPEDDYGTSGGEVVVPGFRSPVPRTKRSQKKRDGNL